MKGALAKADLVQENGPERPDFKIKLFADMDDATPPDSVIASSSSGITMDVIQSGCKRPERCVIGHPFNPPHVIPLVEVVGGAKTSRSHDRARDGVLRVVSARSRSVCTKRFRDTWPTACRPRSTRRYFIWFSKASSAWLMRTSLCATAGASLGRDGSQPAVAPGRRAGRHSTLHGAPDGPAHGHDEGARMPESRRN